MDAVTGVWTSIVPTKRSYLNPHKHFGRANICRAALASYVGIYFLFKWNQQKKAKVSSSTSERRAVSSVT